MKITRGELLTLLRRFQIDRHNTVITAEYVELFGNLTPEEFEQLGEVLAHTDAPAWEPPPTDMIEGAGAELKRLADNHVIDYYLPTIPEGDEFVIGFKGQIMKLDRETVWLFLAGVTVTAEALASRAGIRF